MGEQEVSDLVVEFTSMWYFSFVSLFFSESTRWVSYYVGVGGLCNSDV